LVFGDNHGREAMIGHRDANWARGNSAVTNILLLSAVWVVGAVFADRNAPALGRILDQRGSVTRQIQLWNGTIALKHYYCIELSRTKCIRMTASTDIIFRISFYSALKGLLQHHKKNWHVLLKRVVSAPLHLDHVIRIRSAPSCRSGSPPP
jgi:hypothetical protein